MRFTVLQSEAGSVMPLPMKLNVIDTAIAAASSVSRIDSKTLIVDCRVDYVCNARHAAWLVAFENGATKHRIAKRLNRNPASIRYGIIRATARELFCSDFATMIGSIRKKASTWELPITTS